jgi:hypothetical protein
MHAMIDTYMYTCYRSDDDPSSRRAMTSELTHNARKHTTTAKEIRVKLIGGWNDVIYLSIYLSYVQGHAPIQRRRLAK